MITSDSQYVRYGYGLDNTNDRSVMNAKTIRSSSKGFFRFLPGILWFLVAFYPVYYMFIVSISDKQNFSSGNFWLPPTNPTLSNFLQVIQGNIGLYFLNSIIVTIACVFLIVCLALPAAFAIVKINNIFVKNLFKLFLFGLAIPVQAAIIPIYVMMISVGAYDTLYALIPPQVAFWMPLSILILVNFIRDIPNELYDSMVLDGAGHFRILVKLVLPLSKPAIVAVVLYTGIQVWNNFLFPLVLTQSKDVRTLPFALQKFQGQYGIDIPGLMAAVLLASIPMILLYIIARRQLLGGLTAGFSK